MDDDHSAHRPLLPAADDHSPATGNASTIIVSGAKWVLKLTMWVIFIGWIMVIFLYPASFTVEMFNKWFNATEVTLFGVTGGVFLTFSAPILVIAVLSAVYLVVSGDDEPYRKKKKKSGKEKAKWRLWTLPVVVGGPLEVVMAAELVGIVVVVAYVVWAVYNYTLRMLADSFLQYLTPKQKSAEMLEIMGLRLGSIGLFCLGFLFVPISRGSVLLRLIDIPFEHATRYHVWLGHLTMLIFTLHGLAYVVGWYMQGRCIQQVI